MPIPDDMELFQIGAFTSLGLRRRLRYDSSAYRLVHNGCIPIGSIIMRMQGIKPSGEVGRLHLRGSCWG